MLVVSKQYQGFANRYGFKGDIDEYASFETALGGVSGVVEIHSSEVSRINSVGIKVWKEFFGSLRSRGVKLKFYSLSPALVATMNYITDFIAKDEVFSVVVRFACPSCKAKDSSIIPVTELRKFIDDGCQKPCSKCGKVSELDELPEEYFAFMNY